MDKSLFKKKTQGLVEIGIFGIVILMVFGMLVTFIQKMNGEQYTLMENFRQSLKKSHDNNVIVSYATLDDSRQADVAAPLRRQIIMRSGSSQVHWAIPIVGSYDEEYQHEVSPEPRSWVEDPDEEGGGHWYEHQGVVERFHTTNQPNRQFVYRINEQESSIGKDSNVTWVERGYGTRINDSFALEEDIANISSTRTSNVADHTMEYTLKGSEIKLYRSRNSSDSRSFNVAK